MVFVMLMLPFDDCVFELIRSLRLSANAGYSKINSLRAGSLFLGPLAAPPPKFFLELAQVSYCEQQQKRFPLRTQTYYWSSLLSIRKITGGETRRPEIGLRSQATSRLYLSLSWLIVLNDSWVWERLRSAHHRLYLNATSLTLITETIWTTRYPFLAVPFFFFV